MLGALVVGVGIAVWLVPFVTTGWNLGAAVKMDRRARWGLVLECVGLTMMLQSRFWLVAVWSWREVVSIALFVVATLLAWTATRTLGRRHLRLDAAVIEGHELVRSGPYSVVRHPIYTSFLCVLCGVGVLAAPWWLFLGATAVFLAGTEIRVRTEDGLLVERFGEEFREYRRAVRAYLPLVR